MLILKYQVLFRPSKVNLLSSMSLKRLTSLSFPSLLHCSFSNLLNLLRSDFQQSTYSFSFCLSCNKLLVNFSIRSRNSSMIDNFDMRNISKTLLLLESNLPLPSSSSSKYKVGLPCILSSRSFSPHSAKK